MGVPNLFTSLEKNFDGVITTYQPSTLFHHPIHRIYIDVNNFLYPVARQRDISEQKICSQLNKMIRIIVNMVPFRYLKEVCICFDGPASRAKLQHQRKRRQSSNEERYVPKLCKVLDEMKKMERNNFMDPSCEFTPGTPLMEKLHHSVCRCVMLLLMNPKFRKVGMNLLN